METESTDFTERVAYLRSLFLQFHSNELAKEAFTPIVELAILFLKSWPRDVIEYPSIFLDDDEIRFQLRDPVCVVYFERDYIRFSKCIHSDNNSKNIVSKLFSFTEFDSAISTFADFLQVEKRT